MTNHYRRAEELLEKAAELEDTPRHSIAKTLATMAQAHATLALVKAQRQATEQPLAYHYSVGIDGSITQQQPLAAEREPAPELSDAELEVVDRFEQAPDALLAGQCACVTGKPGDVCSTHDVALPIALCGLTLGSEVDR